MFIDIRIELVDIELTVHRVFLLVVGNRVLHDRGHQKGADELAGAQDVGHLHLEFLNEGPKDLVNPRGINEEDVGG
jgi:hypothetical protein